MGFNCEIKYAEWRVEESLFIDRNLFVDIILETVSRYAGDRPIVYSSFDPDIVYIVSQKQRRYPVLYLTEGGQAKTEDVRKNSLAAAIRWADQLKLDGLCCDVESLLPHRKDVIADILSRGLLLFTYGALNNDPTFFRMQKDLGVHGIISDRWAVSK